MVFLLSRVSHTTQSGIISKLAQGALSVTLFYQQWCQTVSVPTPTPEERCSLLLSTWIRCCWPQDLSVNIQQVLYPLSGLSIKSLYLRFREKDVTQNSQMLCTSPSRWCQFLVPYQTTPEPCWRRVTKSVRHELPIVKPCWLSPIISLLPVCLSTVYSRIYLLHDFARPQDKSDWSRVFLFSILKILVTYKQIVKRNSGFCTGLLYCLQIKGGCVSGWDALWKWNLTKVKQQGWK